MIIWLSGPTGSGKSSFASSLATWGYEVIEENLPNDLFCKFRQSPADHCADLQESIMLARLSQWLLVKDPARVVFDRSPDEDFNIFCRMHFENGLLTLPQFQHLSKVAEKIRCETPKPALIIALTGHYDQILKRLKANGHPDQILASLSRQLEVIQDTRGAKSKYVFTTEEQKKQVSSTLLHCLDLEKPCALVITSNEANAFPEKDEQFMSFVKYIGSLIRFDLFEGGFIHDIRTARPELFQTPAQELAVISDSQAPRISDS